jgi:hypothetical protein
MHEDVHRAAWVLGGRLVLLGRAPRGIGTRGTGSARGGWQIPDRLALRLFSKDNAGCRLQVYTSNAGAGGHHEDRWHHVRLDHHRRQDLRP